jgi:hypothetical protein
MSGQKAAQTKRMSSFSATDCAAARDGNRPVATMASQPSAAAAIASNWAGTIWAASWGRLRPDCFAVLIHWRTGMKAGTSGRSTRSSNARNSASAGAQISTSAPSVRKARPSATSGWTSPRDP